MKKVIFSVLAFILTYNIFKPNISASNNNLILEDNPNSSIFNGHHSHNSHRSHVSHYSTHTVLKTDSISNVNNNIIKLARDNMGHDSLLLHRIYIANTVLSRAHTKDTLYSGPTIVMIAAENDNRIIHWYYITIINDKTKYKAYHTSTGYMNNMNEYKTIYSECPVCADETSFKPWMVELIKQVNNVH